MVKKTAAQLDSEIDEALAEARTALRVPKLGTKSWKFLFAARDRFSKDGPQAYFPPVQPYDRQRMKAVRELIDHGIFIETRTDEEGRLFYTADFPKVEEVYEAWIAKNAPRKQRLSKEAQARLKQVSKKGGFAPPDTN